MTNPAARTDRTARWAAFPLPQLAIFVVLGAVEWAVVDARADASFPASLQALGLVESVWLLMAAVVLLGLKVWEHLPRPLAAPAVARRLAEGLARLRADHGFDRRTAAALVAGAGFLGVFAAASFGWIRYLVANRHGAGLIAMAAVVGQLGIAAGAALVWALVRRWALAGLERLAPRRSATLVLLAAFGLAAAGGVAVAAALFWDTVVAIAGVAIGLPAVATGLAAVSFLAQGGRTGRAGRGSARLVWAAPAVAAVAVVAASWPTAAPQQVLTDGESSRYVFHAAQKVSDLDRDGFAAAPLGADCGAFDPAIHPLAAEVRDNGRDENCDGIDGFAPRQPGDHMVRDYPEGAARPNIVFITVDSLRADHLGYMGYARDTSPNLDAVAKQAVVFDSAFSQDSGTGPSFWSVMAGKTPFQVALTDVDRFPPSISPDERLLAQVLADGGYATSAITCGAVFKSGNWDLERGFGTWGDACAGKTERTAPTVTARALRELARLERGNKPFFLWVHYFDPHHPYTSHEAYDFGDGRIDNYDEEIRYADAEIGKFLDGAKKRLGGEETFYFFGADHGENFGEHGTDPHARTLYREVVHVPMMAWGPGVAPRRVAAPVALSDVYPTMIGLAGIAVPDETTMVSQLPVMLGADADPDRLVFMENSYSRPKRHVKATIGQRYHYIMDLSTGVDELYDYRADPRETDNLLGKGLDAEAELRRALQRFRSTTTLPEAWR